MGGCNDEGAASSERTAGWCGGSAAVLLAPRALRPASTASQRRAGRQIAARGPTSRGRGRFSFWAPPGAPRTCKVLFLAVYRAAADAAAELLSLGNGLALLLAVSGRRLHHIAVLASHGEESSAELVKLRAAEPPLQAAALCGSVRLTPDQNPLIMHALRSVTVLR